MTHEISSCPPSARPSPGRGGSGCHHSAGPSGAESLRGESGVVKPPGASRNGGETAWIALV